ncbi:MAG: ABC transporter permease [Dehalococcoidia bacterium]|nr:ABC transporter permease [Dehalococcoidia bacterium]
MSNIATFLRGSHPRLRTSLRPALITTLSAVIVPLCLFSVFLMMAGVAPLDAFRAMLQSSLGSSYGIGEVLVRAAPFALTALATAIPARAGLLNVGAEGQLVVGALGAAAASALLKDIGIVGLPVLILAGIIGGAAWAGLAAVLRTKLQLNETISTLLLNYVAYLLVAHILQGPLRDPASFNWPFSPPIPDGMRFPVLFDSRVHLGLLIAPVAAIIFALALWRTYWGLNLRVTGGNPQAARRAGIDVAKTYLTVMLIAGAMAGLAGVLQVVGVEGRLRPSTGVGFGYSGFLAAWMVSHHPLWLLGSSLLLAAIVVSGDALQITSGLPSSTVGILTALVLLGVLARGHSQGVRL